VLRAPFTSHGRNEGSATAQQGTICFRWQPSSCSAPCSATDSHTPQAISAVQSWVSKGPAQELVEGPAKLRRRNGGERFRGEVKGLCPVVDLASNDRSARVHGC